MSGKRSGTQQESADGGGEKRARAPRTRKVGPKTADGRSGDLQAFLIDHPRGWTHEDWLGLLDQLRDRGHSVEDPDQIGRILEQERLISTLRDVPGIEDQHAQRIAKRYGSVLEVCQAEPDVVSRTADTHREEAERIQYSL